MMLSSGARCALLVAMSAGWVVLIASAIPAVPWTATRELSLLAVTVAGVGTLALVICRRSDPVTEVLEAGRAIGRAEAIAEAECRGVTRMQDRRRLRVVDGD